MRPYLVGLTLGLLLAPAPAAMAQAITEEAAHAIGVDAYVYLYPLVTMEVTRRQATNIQAGKVLGRGPMNMFINVPEFPPANFRDVVRPNFDTLYSIAWLDMVKEPVVVSVPDTGGRYYLLPMLDMWRMCSLRRAGARRVLRRRTTWSRPPDGAARCRRG